MSISNRVSNYLENKDILFDTVSHDYANSAVGSAIAAQIPPENIAKAVILEDDERRRLMAILPANYKVQLHKLRDQMQVLDLHIVPEQEVYRMFHDCDPGAVPAVGQAYNMITVYDDRLREMSDVYFEAGDHTTLIHLTDDQFEKLMQNARHNRFSGKVFH